MEKIRNTINLFGIPLLLVIGTIVMYLLAKGYRVDFFNGEIDQTGVISVKSFPRKAKVLIDGKSLGSTPKAFGGLNEGTRTVEVQKDDYFDWFISLNLEAEQLLPLVVTLFLENPPVTAIYPEQSADQTAEQSTEQTDPSPENSLPKVLRTYTDGNNKMLMYTVLAPDEIFEGNNKIEIWSLATERNFWEIGREPILVAEFQLSETSEESPEHIPTIDIIISPNGQRSLLSYTVQNTTDFFILYTNRLNDDITPLNEINGPGASLPTWSENSLHLIFSKNNELRSLNTETLAQAVITNKDSNEPFVWTSNEAGQLFYVTSLENSTDITRAEADGSGKTTVIQFPRKNGDRTLFGVEDQDTTDSPEPDNTDETANNTATETIPEPTAEVHTIKLTPNEDNIILFSQTHIVFYSLDQDQTEISNANKPSFISFSPDKERFLYLDEDDTILKEYRFEHEADDPLHSFGPKELLPLNDNNQYSNYSWHPHFTNILFTETFKDSETNEDLSYLSTVDTENLQVYRLTTEVSHDSFSIDRTGDFAVGRCDSTVCSIRFQK